VAVDHNLGQDVVVVGLYDAEWYRRIHFDIELKEEGQIHTLKVLIRIKKRIHFGGGNGVQREFVAI